MQCVKVEECLFELRLYKMKQPNKFFRNRELCTLLIKLGPYDMKLEKCIVQKMHLARSYCTSVIWWCYSIKKCQITAIPATNITLSNSFELMKEDEVEGD